MTFTTPIDEKTAIAFLKELAAAHLLYHPEEQASESLCGQDISAEAMTIIQDNMDLCFKYLKDPCAIALEIAR